MNTRRKTKWDKVAEKEGRIYCQIKDTWCAFIDMKNGTCLIKQCVNERDGAADG